MLTRKHGIIKTMLFLFLCVYITNAQAADPYPESSIKDWIQTVNFVFMGAAPGQPTGNIPSSDQMIGWHADPKVVKAMFDINLGQGINPMRAMISVLYTKDKGKPQVIHFETEDPFILSERSGAYRHSEIVFLQDILNQKIIGKIKIWNSTLLPGLSSKEAPPKIKIEAIIVNIASYRDVCFDCRKTLQSSTWTSNIITALKELESDLDLKNIVVAVFCSGVDDFFHQYHTNYKGNGDKSHTRRANQHSSVGPHGQGVPVDLAQLPKGKVNFFHITNPYYFDHTNQADNKGDGGNRKTLRLAESWNPSGLPVDL